MWNRLVFICIFMELKGVFRFLLLEVWGNWFLPSLRFPPPPMGVHNTVKIFFPGKKGLLSLLSGPGESGLVGDDRVGVPRYLDGFFLNFPFFLGSPRSGEGRSGPCPPGGWG